MGGSDAGAIHVEVVFATPEKQVLRKLQVPPGTSVAEVLARSNLASEFPGLMTGDAATGIWGKPVAADHEVKEGDRVLFGKYAGTEIKIEGEERLIMREDDVIAIVE